MKSWTKSEYGKDDFFDLQVIFHLHVKH